MAGSIKRDDEVTVRSGGSIKPVPDPTELTTQQLHREVLMVKELIVSRLDGYDKAIALLQAKADRSPSIDVVDQSLKSLEAVNNEKFRSISIQFAERDTRTEQTSRDSKVAVDAALQAAKEAVGEQNKSSALAIAKSEASTMKQIDQIGVIISTTNKGTDDKIDDIKTRLTAIESRGQGKSDSWGVMVGGIGAIVGIVAVVIALATFLYHR